MEMQSSVEVERFTMLLEARVIQSMYLVMKRRDFNHHAESGLLLFNHSQVLL